MDDKEKKLWEQFLNEKTKIEYRNALIEYYIPYVKKIAMLFAKKNNQISYDDMFSVGIIGLIAAIEKFNPQRATSFKTYCTKRVYGSMLDELRNIDRIPRLQRSRNTKLLKIENKLLNELSHPPTHSDLHDEYNKNQKNVQNLPYVDVILSLDENVSHKRGHKPQLLREFIIDEKSGSPTDVSNKQDFLKQVLKSFNKIERIIIIEYYYENKKMIEIAQSVNLSESRISQVLKKLKKRMQENLKNFEKWIINKTNL